MLSEEFKMNHNGQKKIAVINDISGFGRCSITVALPIISQMKIQCCPLPTSIFSNHTAYPNYFFDDYTEKMPEYIENWKKLKLHFNGILSGFLGSKKQIETVKGFIKDFRKKDTMVIIDPVMGDNGKPYRTYTHEMCMEMKELCKEADILTPNLTEACLLTDTPYTPKSFTTKDYYKMAKELSALAKADCKVVITGIDTGSFLENIIYEPGLEPKKIRQKKAGCIRSGTGDVFSAIIAADAVNGTDFTESVKKAAAFVKKSIMATEKYNLPPADGVCFEDVLYTLKSSRREN